MNLNIKGQAKHLGRLLQESSPTILTGLGVVGVVGTGYLVAKASFQARDKIVAREDEVGIVTGGETQLPTKQKVELIWKLYLPAVGVGSLTIAAIIASNRIHARRLAALAAGYAIISKDFDEYRDKAAEKLGIKKADELEKDITSKKMESAPMPGGVLPGGKTWFCDMSRMYVFPSTMETIKSAQNDINYVLNNQSEASLNEFYAQLGHDPTSIGDILGWNSTKKLELVFTPILTDEHGAVTAFRFKDNPFPKY